MNKTAINAFLKEALCQAVKSSHNHDLTVYEPSPCVWELRKEFKNIFPPPFPLNAFAL